MPMLVRIEMCRLTADEQPEAFELSMQLTSCVPAYSCRRHGRTSPWGHAASPPPQLDVQSDSEPARFACELRRLCCRPAVHHQTRTCDNPALVRLDDSAVDTTACAEVVGVHDQRLQGTRIRSPAAGRIINALKQLPLRPIS